MITFEIKPSPESLGRLTRLAVMFPEIFERGARNAVNRTIRGGRQDASRKIAARYTIATRKVEKTMKTRTSGTTGYLESEGTRNPLEEFNIKPRNRPRVMPPNGVFAQVVKGQGGNLRRAFVGTKGGVYERIKRTRYPLRRFYSVSAPQMLGSRPVSTFLIKKLEDRLAINLEHSIGAVFGGFLPL